MGAEVRSADSELDLDVNNTEAYFASYDDFRDVLLERL